MRTRHSTRRCQFFRTKTRRRPTGPSVRAGIGLSSGGLAGLSGFGWVWTALAASRQIEAHVPSMLEAEASRQLFTTRQKFQASQAVCSRLELATQPSREVKQPEHFVWQNMTFYIPSHPTIYIPLYPRFKESFQREF